VITDGNIYTNINMSQQNATNSIKNHERMTAFDEALVITQHAPVAYFYVLPHHARGGVAAYSEIV
jgi:hypothetical protein